MINIQIPDEDLQKLVKALIEKSDSPFTISSLLGIILNIIFVLTMLFLFGVI